MGSVCSSFLAIDAARPNNEAHRLATKVNARSHGPNLLLCDLPPHGCKGPWPLPLPRHLAERLQAYQVDQPGHGLIQVNKGRHRDKDEAKRHKMEEEGGQTSRSSSSAASTQVPCSAVSLDLRLFTSHLAGCAFSVYQGGESGLVPAPKLTDFRCTPSMST